MIITGQFIFLLIIAIILTILALFADTKICTHLSGSSTAAKQWRRLFVTLLVLTIIGLGLMNFQVTLTLLMFGTGIVVVIDKLFFQRARVTQNSVQPFIVENAYSFFGVLLLVWVIRSFLIQPYRVPTGSLEPTIAPGDFLVVNQFAYGLRFPIGNKEMVAIGKPQRGDITLFYYPIDPNIVFVKRVIGLPGDHIQYLDKVLYINGREMKQTDLGNTLDNEPASGNNPEEHIPVEMKEENLDGIKHKIYINKDVIVMNNNFSVDVPAGSYFMMGDNRDNSDDSRVWGFVPKENLLGKAFGIWMSWDALQKHVRWNRIGLAVQ